MTVKPDNLTHVVMSIPAYAELQEYKEKYRILLRELKDACKYTDDENMVEIDKDKIIAIYKKILSPVVAEYYGFEIYEEE